MRRRGGEGMKGQKQGDKALHGFFAGFGCRSKKILYIDYIDL